MEKLTRNELQRLDERLRRISSADSTIARIGENLGGKSEAYGEAVRLAIGRNLLSQFTNERLGQIVGCAVINALLEMRNECAEEIEDRVEVPCAPCPVQFPSLSEES